MALVTIKRAFELEESFVLAPERYDPRRESLKTNGKHAGSAANVKQGFVATQSDLLRNLLEKLWRIGLPVASVEFNR